MASKRTLKRSRIGYTSPEVPAVYSWNAGGAGCSGGCDGCWSRKGTLRLRGQIAKHSAGTVDICGNLHHICRATCKDGKVRTWHVCERCANFEVHLHPERLCEPANTKTPRVVLVNFTADTFDRRRNVDQIGRILGSAADAPRHNYVFLTKQPRKMGAIRKRLVLTAYASNWYMGLTIRNQAEADEKLGAFLSIPGNLWLSLEPLEGALDFGYSRWKSRLQAPLDTLNWLQGVIVGMNNRRGAPGTDTLDHIRSVVKQCQAAGVPVYVKQLYMLACNRCGAIHDDAVPFPNDKAPTAHHRYNDGCHSCKSGALRWKFLRASKPAKPGEPSEFDCYPEDLKLRDLPWGMPQEDGHG